MQEQIDKKLYACDPELGEINQYWLCNERGVWVGVLNYGLTVTDFMLPDRTGNLVNVVLGFPDFSSLRRQTAFANAIIGRYANRVAHARFRIEGRDFTLSRNENYHHLHGGLAGFDKKLWEIEYLRSNSGACSLCARLTSSDGEEGYPGVLDCHVILSLDNDNRLIFKVLAATSRPTHVNITSHLYFNLSGSERGDVKNHIFMIPSTEVVDIDASGIPSGRIISIDGGSLDFSRPKVLQEAFSHTDPQIEKRNGIDHCYILNHHNESGSMKVAEVFCPSTGLKLQVESTQPGLQFYTGQYLKDLVSPSGSQYAPFAGFCLEPQHFPDTPNQSEFPPTLLLPGETYEHCFAYKVTLLKES
ncbi:aldose epimerase family protein [Halomonas sp. NO4]|uniref:aldose epimerase family protein n=1 Tax=Halomonas sp. NO4 TaxID=2484813 RepID=UPI0013CF46BD|nr:aldose epimerase family protein [Halomonas sp. NO4]